MENIKHVPLSTFDATDIKQVCQFNPSQLPSLDAQQAYFFNRELEYIIPEMLEFEYGRISARTVFPMDMRAGPGAEVITLRQMTKVGAARIVSDYANDIPLSNVFTSEVKSNVRSIAEAAEWSIQEIRASAMTNRDIDRDKTDAAREDMLRLENKIAWAGDADHGLAGFFTDGNIPRFTVATGGGGFTEWDTKTGPEIVDDLNQLVNPISEDTNGVEAPNRVVIPRKQYNIAHTKRMETGTDTTALQYFVNNSPYIASMDDVIPVDDISGLGDGGVDAMFAYEYNSSKLVMNVPLDIEQFPPQERDMVTKVIYHMRFGGVLIKKPLSIRIGEGI